MRRRQQVLGVARLDQALDAGVEASSGGQSCRIGPEPGQQAGDGLGLVRLGDPDARRHVATRRDLIDGERVAALDGGALGDRELLDRARPCGR